MLLRSTVISGFFIHDKAIRLFKMNQLFIGRINFAKPLIREGQWRLRVMGTGKKKTGTSNEQPISFGKLTAYRFYVCYS